MASSEELNQINSALSHCTQLKSQLQGTLLHIQRLNAKYNQTDYMAVIRNMDNYRKSSSITSSPYSKRQRQNDESIDDSNTSYTSTPVKRPTLFRRKQLNCSPLASTSTPMQSKRLPLLMHDDSFRNASSEFDTPKRSVREIKQKGNRVSVRTIKVQRNIEAIITRLEVMQKSHKKRQMQQLEQSLYQSSNNSSFGSPGPLNGTQYLEQSFNSMGSSFGCNNSVLNISTTTNHTPIKFNRTIQYDQDQRTLDSLQRFYATPLQKMHKRLIHLNASLVSTC